MTKRKRLSQQVTNLIWGRSGGRCYLDRTEELSRTESGNLPIGEVAHIVAETTSGPRGQDSLELADRNKADNLILLCPNHHAEIDKHPEVWTIERLKKAKEAHEQWVRDSLDHQITAYSYFSDARKPLEIEFDWGKLRDNKSPTFGFSLRNMATCDLVVHSVDAEVLALGVLPSERDKEFRRAVMALIPRTPVTFDFASAKEGDFVGPTKERQSLERLFMRSLHFDPFEVAILLSPGEVESFCATLFPGSFAMGTFRLVATYWLRPEFHYKAFSPSVGFFSVPDRGMWPFWGNRRVEEDAKASVVSFDTITAEAAKNSGSERPVWSEDVFDRPRLFQRTVGRLEHARSRATIEKWLSMEQPSFFIAALEAIDAAPNTQWKRAMTERALASSNEAVRSNAVSIVGDWKYTDVFESLAVKILTDPSPLVRRRALQRLRYDSSPRIDQVKRGLMNDPNAEVRALAHACLKERRDVRRE